MSNIHTEVVSDAHAYTHSPVPWEMGEYRSSYGKLIHYLSGGGMRTFGRTVRQEETRIRQNRFLAVAAVLFVLWFLFLIF